MEQENYFLNEGIKLDGIYIEGIKYSHKLTIGALLILDEINLFDLSFANKVKILWAQINYDISLHNNRYNSIVPAITLKMIIKWAENHTNDLETIILEMFKASKPQIELYENNGKKTDGSLKTTLVATASQFNLQNYKDLTLGELNDIVHILLGKSESINERTLDGVGGAVEALKLMKGGR